MRRREERGGQYSAKRGANDTAAQKNAANEKERTEHMAITGKQVRQLRSMANTLKTTVIVGKSGVTASVLKQVEDALEAHELIKVSVLCETGKDAAQTGREMAEATNSELVQVIGKRVVLYRETSRKDVKKIELVQ